MVETTVYMPKMGESVIEVTVLKWLQQVGDLVTEGTPILEVATDKVDAEVPVNYSGTIKELLVQEGSIVAIGAPIATMLVAAKDNNNPPTQAIATTHHTTGPPHQPSTLQKITIKETFKGNAARLYSPLVQHIAQQEGISPQELAHIPATAKDNRVSKKDLLRYITQCKQGSYKVNAPTTDKGLDSFLTAPGDIVTPMGRVRKLIADRMVASKQTAPHVTSFISADVTNLVLWKSKNKVIINGEKKLKITYLPFFIKAIAQTLQKFPPLNASVVGDHIITKKDINIGLAVALPDGNLIVPVIKLADQRSLLDLATQINTLVEKARHQQLTAEDLTGGTYTVSNIGSFKNLMGTPIIMQPQVAILALGAITKQAAVVSTDQGDTITIRHEMYLSHTYDHRVIDGTIGGSFIKEVANYLSHFNPQTGDF